MTTVTAIDTQFAVGSGANYDSQNGRSGFDVPLSANSGLVITSSGPDPTPYLFELGETFDLTWDGPTGAMSMNDAVIVRSDNYYAKTTQGVVVFEGTDQNGTPTHVVWTENLDVHQWYNDNYNGPNPPVFWNTDRDASTYGHICFAAETRLMTPDGPREVGGLRPGESVMTLDHGPQQIRWIGSRTVRGRGRARPVEIAPGLLGNNLPLVLSPQHRVLVRGKGQEALVPAKALLHLSGVTRRRCEQITYVNILLDRHEIVQAQGGALCETLLVGPMTRAVVAARGYPRLPAGPLASTPARPLLKVGEARARLMARP